MAFRRKVQSWCTQNQIQSPAVATPSVFILFAIHSGIFSAISAHFSGASMMVNTFRLESTIFKQKVFRCVFTNFIFIMTWLRAGLNMRAQMLLCESFAERKQRMRGENRAHGMHRRLSFYSRIFEHFCPFSDASSFRVPLLISIIIIKCLGALALCKWISLECRWCQDSMQDLLHNINDRRAHTQPSEWWLITQTEQNQERKLIAHRFRYFEYYLIRHDDRAAGPWRCIAERRCSSFTIFIRSFTPLSSVSSIYSILIALFTWHAPTPCLTKNGNIHLYIYIRRHMRISTLHGISRSAAPLFWSVESYDLFEHATQNQSVIPHTHL